MRMKKPNYYLFEEGKKYYIYDVNINSIVSIPEELYWFLDEWKNDIDREIPESLIETMQFLTEHGYLSEKRKINYVSHFEAAVLHDLLDSNMSSIILQVTQNCNLRCKYCVYSGSYINRTHTKARMSVDTAKKAIDFLASHSSNSSDISIGFYGGEPLLEISLIEEIVTYAKGIFGGKKINFNITTNATLLNMDIANFLIENDFNITVSLDGPKEIHNKNRVFANSNKGSFDTVMKNIEAIKERFPEAIGKIAFNAVIDMSQDVGCSNDFFMSYDTVKNMGVNGTFVNQVNRKDVVKYDYKNYADANYEVFKVFLYACNKKLFNVYKPTVFGSEISSIKQTMCDRYVGKEGFEDRISPGGQCLPGIQRFFVTVDGKFFPCERVDETSNDLCIGNLEEGIAIDKALSILNIAQLTTEQCKNCWCYKMCYQCVAKAQKDGKIDASARLKWCTQTKENVENTIRNYIVLKKYGCEFEEV